MREQAMRQSKNAHSIDLHPKQNAFVHQLTYGPRHRDNLMQILQHNYDTTIIKGKFSEIVAYVDVNDNVDIAIALANMTCAI